MKIIATFASLAAVMSLCAVSMAQQAGPQGGPPPQSAPGHTRGAQLLKLNEEILSKLGLSNAQKAQVKDLMTKTKADIKDLRTQAREPNADRSVLKAKVKEIRETFRKTMMQILTPAQQKQYKAELKAARAKLLQKTPPPTP
jgi:Spy/CpxP family protein refolding chaperone